MAEDIVGGLLGAGAADTRPSSDSLTTTRAIAHFYTSLWAVRNGDTGTVERSMQSLHVLKPRAEAPWDRSQSVLFKDLLGAHLALARKSPD